MVNTTAKNEKDESAGLLLLRQKLQSLGSHLSERRVGIMVAVDLIRNVLVSKETNKRGRQLGHCKEDRRLEANEIL
jgi:hypothetical protein